MHLLAQMVRCDVATSARHQFMSLTAPQHQADRQNDACDRMIPVPHVPKHHLHAPIVCLCLSLLCLRSADTNIASASALSCHAGMVLLLTNPVVAGYTQNPISVYYCYDADGRLAQAIAEVGAIMCGAAHLIQGFEFKSSTIPDHLSEVSVADDTDCTGGPPPVH